MSMTYQQLSELCDSLDNELTDVNKLLTDAYDYSEMVQQMNHDLRLENIRVRVLYSSLDKRIKQKRLQ